MGVAAQHAALPEQLAQLFPWFAPVAVAVVAGLWLDRKYARRAPRRPANPATPTAVTRSP